ncbi:hypothetical protein [Frigoriglobus tundricola]|uniref:Uncharacterized protein n=1 Tax=Frigoriglobus tundricola TaxID=2774151 RepID=A0A6M5YIJ5_9BACT|nr:hypothetical protein [Frigoriglobus tundricola]QJW93150.1 hypothetical protein FTUN_0655 [Frigoriglobus tundricola]
MSEERIPSVAQLSMLRARLVRFQLYAEAAGLWPGVASFKGCGDDAVRTSAQFLRLCEDAVELSRAIHTAVKGGMSPHGGWSSFSFSALRQIKWELGTALTFVAMGWLVDYEPLCMEIHLDRRDILDDMLADGAWIERFTAFAPGVGESSAQAARRRRRGLGLESMRLNEGITAALTRCVRHLDELLTHGTCDEGHEKRDEDPEDEPLAVRIPPALPQAGARTETRKGACVLVLGKPKKLRSAEQMSLIAALVDSAEFGLTHEDAKRIHSNASKVLNDLCKNDPDWRRAIELPGNSKGGYRIRRRSEALADEIGER